MLTISFDEFWIRRTRSINLSKEKHHPSYHYPGAPITCELCDSSMEDPRQEYNRIHPDGLIEDNVSDVEIILNGEEKKTLTDIPQKKNKLQVFKESPVWNMIFKDKESFLPKSKEIEQSTFLKPKGVKGSILIMPDVGYTRTLSIIECLIAIEESQNKQIHEMYDIINGSGNSSILSLALALGKPMQEIKNFWLEKWILAYTVGITDRVKKTLSVKKRFGYSVKKAKKILEEFFKKNDFLEKQYKLSDLKTEIYQPSIYGRLKEGTFYSQGKNPDLPIVDVLMDTAIDPYHFDAVETVKNKGIPLMIYDSELMLLLQNGNCSVTKINAPYPHVDYGSLNNATSSELSLPERDKNILINNSNIDSFVSNYPVKRLEINCKPIPNQIHRNSTDKQALALAIEAGMKTEVKKTG